MSTVTYMPIRLENHILYTFIYTFFWVVAYVSLQLWHQVLFHTNNLHTFVCFQVFLSDINNSMVSIIS